MKRFRLTLVVLGTICSLLAASAVIANHAISTKITSRAQNELRNGTGISASIPLIDLPQNLTSNSIKSLTFKVAHYSFKKNNTQVSLEIKAREVSKKNPIKAKSIDINATIPASTILENAQFNNAHIVGKTLQVSVGAGGGGIASLVPRYEDNQIFFQLESVSIFGSEIPASSLPSDFQAQIKSKSSRTFRVPKGLKVESLSISSKGLSVNLIGRNIQLSNLGEL